MSMPRVVPFTTWILLLTAVAQTSAHAATTSQTSLVSCLTSKLTSFLRKEKKSPPSKKELQRLSRITFADHFPKSETVAVGTKDREITRTVFDESDEAEFKKTWDHLLDQKIPLMNFDVDALKAANGGSRYPKLDAMSVESYKTAGLTLNDLQDDLVIDYNMKRYGDRGDFEGLKKYLSRQSPYFLGKMAKRGVKYFKEKAPMLIGLGIVGGIVAPIPKLVIDPYTKKVDQVKSKALEQLPEHKALADAINANGTLQQTALGIDFEKISSKNARLAKWTELEKQFRQSHAKIRGLRAKIRSSSDEDSQGKSKSALQLRATRQTFVTQLTQLAKDKSTLATMTKAQSMGDFKALDILMPPSAAEEDSNQDLIDQIMGQIARNPEAFQAFVTEFLKMQELTSGNAPVTPAAK